MSQPHTTAILLLKSPSPSPSLDPYTSTLSPLGPIPTYIPILSHQLLPDSLIKLLLAYFDPLSPRFSHPFPYGGIVITSQRAVAALGAALASPIIQEKVPQKDLERRWEVGIWVVGPATERAVIGLVEKYKLSGVRVRGGEGAGNGEKLAEMMLGVEGYEVDEEEEEEEQEVDGQQKRRRRKPVLFLVGETRRDVIPRMLQDEKLSVEKRVKVHEMVVYQSSELQSFEFDFARQVQMTAELGDGERWVVVFSPIGGKGMLQGLRWLNESTGKVDQSLLDQRTDRVCCIGPTTRSYLEREFGFVADAVADKPSPEGVKKAILTFMKQKEGS